MVIARDLKTVVHTHGSPAVLLRVCLRCNLRRETGRWPSVFLLRKSRLRFAASGPHSPPRRRTRGRRSDLSLPLQEKSDSGIMSGQPTAPGLGNQRPQLQPVRPVPTLPPSRHTDRGVLAQPFNNSKKSGRGQCLHTYAANYSRNTRRQTAASRRRVDAAVGHYFRRRIRRIRQEARGSFLENTRPPSRCCSGGRRSNKSRQTGKVGNCHRC